MIIPPQPKKTFVKCEICGNRVRSDNLTKHIDKVHLKRVKNSTKTCKICGKSVRKLQKHMQAVHKNATKIVAIHKNTTKIVLISKRGIRVKDGRCDECGMLEKVVWRYAQSNCGTVYICDRCKPKILDSSFGRIDALDTAISGGAFETNPHRH
jgi:DNA-directed RNA polymerase subunit M/transcription elongation factor TFIIS